MSQKKLWLSVVSTGIWVCTLANPGWAQLTSAPQPVTLNALAPESLSVTLTTPGPVTFNLNGGTVPGSVVPAWTTNWNLANTRTSLAVCVYLTGALTAPAPNTDTIPPANILGQPDATGPFAALTGAGCGQTNALVISTTAITNANRRNGSRNNSVALEINQTGLSLAPDTYTGTLNIIAQATP
jgi:hypothetical protein